MCSLMVRALHCVVRRAVSLSPVSNSSSRRGRLPAILAGAALFVVSAALAPTARANDPASGAQLIFLPGTQSVITANGSINGSSSVLLPVNPPPVNLTYNADGSWDDPESIAIDGSNNVWVVDAALNVLYKIPYSGGAYSTPVAIDTGLCSPFGVAVDGSGNVYVANSNAAQASCAANVVEYVGGVLSGKRTIGVTGDFVSPNEVAVDGSGNVYVADFGGGFGIGPGNGVWKITNSGTVQIGGANTGPGSNYPYAVTVDSSGNVYVAVWAAFNTSGIVTQSTVYKLTWNGGNSYTESVVSTDFVATTGIVVDPAGDLYVSDDNTNAPSPPGAVYKLTPSGSTYIKSTVPSISLDYPESVALDDKGNLYILDFSGSDSGPNTTPSGVYKQDYTDPPPPTLSFGSVNFGSTSSEKTATLENIGNATLTFTNSLSDLPSGYILGSGNTCSDTELLSGASCTLAIAFEPTVGGGTPENGNVVLTLTQEIAVTGTGIGTAGVAPAFTSASSTTFTLGAPGSFTVTASGTPAPTFSESGTLPSGVTLSSAGVLSGTPGGSGGVYNLTLKATNSVGSKTQAFTLNVDQPPTVTGISPSSGPAGGGASVTIIGTGFTGVTAVNFGTVPATSYTVVNPTTITATTPPGAGAVDVTVVTSAGRSATTPSDLYTYALVSVTANPISAAAGSPFSGEVATFVDNSGNAEPVSNFTDNINWGDGTTSVGTITQPGGASTSYLVTGNHTYASGGSYSFTVTVTPSAGPAAQGGSTATVSMAPAIISTNGATFNEGMLGTFVVTATGSPTPSFSETGALPSGVSFHDNGNGTATLTGAPAVGGTFPITITATNGVSPSATQNFTLMVDFLVAVTPNAISAVAEAPFTAVLASFSSAADLSSVSNFSAAIDWGDGTVSAGTITQPGGAGAAYITTGTHTYPVQGIYTFTVTVTPVLGFAALSSGTATVAPAPATHFIVTAPPSAFVGGAFSFNVAALDQFNNPTIGYSGTVHFTSSDHSAVLPVDSALTNGFGTFSATLVTAGSQTITATDANNSSLAGTSAGISVTIPNFVVENTNDSGIGSLRAALASAASAGSGNVTFDPTVFATAQTISLTSGTLTIPSYTSITGATSGGGATLTNLLTVNGGSGRSGQFSVFTVNSGTTGAAISNVIITNGVGTLNSGPVVGGAIFNNGGLTVTDSTFSGNSVGTNSEGGAIANAGTLTVIGCTFVGNSAGSSGGGGAIVNSSTLTVTNSTFSTNSAGTGGIGGAILNAGIMTLTSDTFSGNSVGAGGFGGAIFDAEVMTVNNSIFSQDGDECDGTACPTSNLGGNLVDPTGTQALLAPLGSYGGPTQTMILLPGSLAICAGSASTVASAGIATDQRGVALALTTSNASTYTGVGGYCSAGFLDMGAVETGYAIAFVQQPPATVFTGAVFSPSPAVQLSESGASIALSGVNISLAPTLGTLTGTTTEATGSSGLATFGGLSVATAESNDLLKANLTLNPDLPGPTIAVSASSSQFNVQVPEPTVIGISPTTGPNTGGTSVTITGTNFNGTTAVYFGGVPATSFSVVSDSQISAFSPTAPSAQTVDVTVTTPSGTSATSSVDQFTYFVPVATSLTSSVTPGIAFVYANQPTISVAVSPSTATGTLTATLDGSTALTVTAGSGGNFSIALPATPLTVGSHSITINFLGALTGAPPYYAPSSASISLTVTTPSLVVNTATDDATGVATNCTSSPEGTCALRDALAAAASAGAANITFSPSAFSTAQTITLTSGTLNIPSNTSIVGPTSSSGATLTNLLTVNGNNASPVFTVGSGVTGASVSGLIITGGSGGSGGTIPYNGGGIENIGTLTLTNSTVSGNNARVDGGGIFNEGTLTLTNSTVSSNSAPDGGGICNFLNSTLTLIDSTVSGNNASINGDGGGISNYGTLTLTNSTVSGNSAPDGGGIFNDFNGILTLTNSTVSANSSSNSGYGGGIFNFGTLTLANSIVAGNSATSGTGADIYSNGGTYNNNGGNLASTGSGGTSTIDPMLAPLANYGGPTQTVIPLPGSPAICAGLKANIPAGLITDQRGDPNINTSYPGYSTSTPCVDAGAVQTDYAISFTAPVSNVAPTIAMSPAPAVTLDESGAPFTAAAVTIPLSFTSNPPGTTLSGGSAATRAGVATYSSLTVNLPGTGDQLTAVLPLNTSPAVSLTALSGTFNVSQITPTLSFTPIPASQTYGTAITAGSLDATASYNSANVAGTFAYTTTVNGNPVTLAAGTTVLPAGNYTITAIFTPNNTTIYESTSTTASYMVIPAMLTITASSGSMTYGGTTPTITPSYSPFANGDSAASLTTQPTCSTAATSHRAVGSYTSSCTGAVDANYMINYTAGSVTVGQATLTITASSGSMTYGGATPIITPSYSPFTNGDSAASLTTQPTCSTTATNHSPVGNYSSSCTGAADANYKIGYTAGSVTVTDATLIIAANNATKIYGTANPTFNGLVTGQLNSDTFTESFSTGAIVSSPVGSYTIVPSVTGTDLADYTQSIVNGELTVTQAASITTIGLSSATITPGQNETITANVASSTTGTPTGSVNIFDGTTLLATVPLSGGTASYTTASLAPGVTHSISAVYSGDTNFTGSNSSTTASVTVAPLDFTMTITGPSSATVIPGQSISYQVTVTPLYGSYAGTVNFAIAGLPPGASVTFSPSSIAANGGPQTITVTITSAPATAANHAPSLPSPTPSPTHRSATLALAFLLIFGLGAMRRRGRGLRRLVCIVLLLAGGTAATLATGCGGGFFAQAQQNYTVTITATAGGIQHTTNVTLNVQ